MAEGEPLTREQLVAAAGQLDRLGLGEQAIDQLVDDVMERGKVLAGLTDKERAVIYRVEELKIAGAVFNAYQNAFLIAAGVKPPVIEIGEHTIELDLSGQIGINTAGKEDIPEDKLEMWEHTH